MATAMTLMGRMMGKKKMRKKEQGFTLIELLIAIVIVGILMAVAIPSYSKYMTQSRRLDAIAFLQEVAGEQVRFFSENNVFATNMTELGYGADATYDTPDGHYTLSIDNAVVTSFTLTATPVAAGLQADDTDCANLTLDSTGLKGASGPSGVEGCW